MSDALIFRSFPNGAIQPEIASGGCSHGCNISQRKRLQGLKAKLNWDARYCEIAKNQEAVCSFLSNQKTIGRTIEDMMYCGERGWNPKRAINNRMGLTRANDKLPKAMLFAYYQARDWDVETGKPSHSKLVELGLTDIANDLWE